MAHKLAADAGSDLDDIWHYVATESGSAARADKFVASLTDRFFALARNPDIDRRRDVVVLRVLRGSRDIESLLER